MIYDSTESREAIQFEYAMKIECLEAAIRRKKRKKKKAALRRVMFDSLNERDGVPVDEEGITISDGNREYVYRWCDMPKDSRQFIQDDCWSDIAFVMAAICRSQKSTKPSG